MKVYQIPLATPQSRGKALINLLPLEKDESISVYLRMPENEELWDKLDIMFATSHGTVRRNKLSDFKNIRSNGLIAMKLGDDEQLVSVKICKDDEDVLLATKKGKAIRFPVSDIRVFSGRTSTGVRGVKLKEKGDEVISMSILRHMEITPEERSAYMKAANRVLSPDEIDAEESEENVSLGAENLGDERYRELLASEQLLLTVTNKGYGKRTSAYEYRVSGRGGQGVTNMALTKKNGGEVVATFPVTDSHQIMLVTDKGQLIRTRVENIRITGRSAQGVTIFRVGEDENVVSVAWLIQDEDETNGNGKDETNTEEAADDDKDNSAD